MGLEILSTSVCVVAREHNPTILHPAFLISQGIVPHDWCAKSPPICTPAFSVTEFENGIVFNVESNQFVVTDRKPPANPGESRVAKLTIAYVQKLPHVRYTAVGVNLHGFVISEKPEDYLIERFLKDGSWNSTGCNMTGLGLKFVYSVDGAQLRVGCDGGTLRRNEGEQRAILVNGNYHTDLPEDGALDVLQQALLRWRDRCQDFGRFTKLLLGLED